MVDKKKSKVKKKLSKSSYFNKFSSKIDGLKDIFGASQVRNRSEKNTIKICLTNFWRGFEFEGSFLENLININSKLWNIEDDIRECERKKLFDQTFIDLARSVYFTNDERAKVKNDINKTFGSELVEVKSYEEY